MWKIPPLAGDFPILFGEKIMLKKHVLIFGFPCLLVNFQPKLHLQSPVISMSDKGRCITGPICGGNTWRAVTQSDAKCTGGGPGNIKRGDVSIKKRGDVTLE